MVDDNLISTWDVLKELGFKPAGGPSRGMVFDFGNFTLKASESRGSYFSPIVAFSGFIATPRTMSQIEFELPAQTETREQCLAMLAYAIDHSTSDREFDSIRHAHWMDEGRKLSHLLPWRIAEAKRMEELRTRPHCVVYREWARLAIKWLGYYIQDISDETPIEFAFKESILTIRVDERLIATAGEGWDWAAKYEVSKLDRLGLPKRFNGRSVVFGFWNNKFWIGGSAFEKVLKVDL